jgi:hypothetical protein
MKSLRSARRWSGESVLNLDSLVDVVTNTNGMLILLAVFTTIMSMGKTYEVSYPMVRPTNKTPIFLECQGNRVVLVRRNGVFGEHYRPLFFGEGVALLLEDGEWGEDAKAILKPDSQFRRIVAEMDPAKEHLFFLVRPDSFEIFRAARDLIWENRAEVDVGWEPLEKEMMIMLGRSGRSPDPQ